MAGVGGVGAGNIGVLIADTGSRLQTEDSSIRLTGVGTGSAESANNDGISIFNGASVVATGAGDIFMNGTGGARGTTDNQGIAIGSSARRSSARPAVCCSRPRSAAGVGPAARGRKSGRFVLQS